MNRVKADNKGFSLLEMVICVAALALISLAVMQGFAAAARLQQQALRRGLVNDAAGNISEQLKAGIPVDAIAGLEHVTGDTYTYTSASGSIVEGIEITVENPVAGVHLEKAKLPSAPLFIEATTSVSPPPEPDAEVTSLNVTAVYEPAGTVTETAAFTYTYTQTDAVYDPETGELTEISYPVTALGTSIVVHSVPSECTAVFYIIPESLPMSPATTVSGTDNSIFKAVRKNSFYDYDTDSYIGHNPPVQPLSGFTVKVGDIEFSSEFTH